MMAIYKSKILLILIAALIFALIFPQAVFSADGLKLSTVSTKGDAGGRIAITVRAENAAGSEGGQFTLNFDPELVRPLKAEAGELVENARSDMFMANLEYAPGRIIVLWVTPYADTADSGVVCEINFELLKAGETAIAFSEIVIAPDGIEAAPSVPGKITVSRSAPAAGPVESGEAAEPVGDDEPEEDSDDHEPGDDDQVIDDDNEQILGENGDAGNTASYAIWLVALVFAVTIGGFIINRLKKPGVKNKKR